MNYIEKDGKYMVILDKDEKLLESLNKFAKEKNILGGAISGIGAIKDVEIGYYELETKTYHKKIFSNEDYELLQINGNISLKNDGPFCHIHGSFSGSDYNVLGGHFFEAIIAVTCEVSIIPFGIMPERKFNCDIGLDLITVK